MTLPTIVLAIGAVAVGCVATADMKFPVFYLTPRTAPDHLRERVIVVPQPLQGTPILTNRVAVALDPESESDENYEVSQFHSQDALGRFIFGFHSPDQVRMETRNSDGSVRGSYSYVDPFGMTIKMQYWDDGEGFHASGNALPVAYHKPPEYTPEVQAARDEHFRLYRQALIAALASGQGEEKLGESNDYAEEVDNGTEREEVEGEAVVAGSNYEDEAFHSLGLSGLGQMMEDEGEDEGEDEDEGVAVENPHLTEENAVLTKFWQRRGKNAQLEDVDSRRVPPAVPQLRSSAITGRSDDAGGFFYQFQHYVPVSIKMADPERAETSESLSSMAYRAGAIPIAAVHDTQVSPRQKASLPDYQTMPLFTHRLVSTR